MLFVILIIVAYAILMNAGNIVTATAASNARKNMDKKQAFKDVAQQNVYGDPPMVDPRQVQKDMAGAKRRSGWF